MFRADDGCCHFFAFSPNSTRLRMAMSEHLIEIIGDPSRIRTCNLARSGLNSPDHAMAARLLHVRSLGLNGPASDAA
jgi:hypothetical protein